MQIEVISGLSDLYFLIEQHCDSLPKVLNNKSMIENIVHGITSHNGPADGDPSSSSTQIPRRDENNEF